MIFKYAFITIVCGLTVVPVYAKMRRLYLTKKNEKTTALYEISCAAFLTFAAALTALVLEPRWLFFWDDIPYFEKLANRLTTLNEINLVPFKMIRGFFSGELDGNFIRNIIGNIIMFVPFGICMPLLWKRFRSVRTMLITAFAIPLFIETAQLFVGRSPDVDDIILNSAGILAGGGIYIIAMNIYKKRTRKV